MTTEQPKVGDNVNITVTIQGKTTTGDIWVGTITKVNHNNVTIGLPTVMDTDPDEKLADPSKRFRKGPDAIINVKSDDIKPDGKGGWNTCIQVKLT